MEEKKKHNNRTEDFFMIGHLGHLGVRYKTPPPKHFSDRISVERNPIEVMGLIFYTFPQSVENYLLSTKKCLLALKCSDH